MRRYLIVFSLFFLNASGIFAAQNGADPSQRYFRLICLVHLKGSGQANDPVVPEYVAEGTAVAQASAAAAAAAGAASAAAQPMAVAAPGAAGQVPGQPSATPGGVAMAARPGFLGWSMLKSDDGTMAIIQIVAADRHAFDSLLADTRPEIRVFEIGKDSPAAIQAEMQKYRKDFNLSTFQVRVQ